eukprot:8898462-Lingulodinium_polyedra.AAC.1
MVFGRFDVALFCAASKGGRARSVRQFDGRVLGNYGHQVAAASSVDDIVSAAKPVCAERCVPPTDAGQAEIASILSAPWREIIEQMEELLPLPPESWGE